MSRGVWVGRPASSLLLFVWGFGHFLGSFPWRVWRGAHDSASTLSQFPRIPAPARISTQNSIAAQDPTPREALEGSGVSKLPEPGGWGGPCWGCCREGSGAGPYGGFQVGCGDQACSGVLEPLRQAPLPWGQLSERGPWEATPTLKWSSPKTEFLCKVLPQPLYANLIPCLV